MALKVHITASSFRILEEAVGHPDGIIKRETIGKKIFFHIWIEEDILNKMEKFLTMK